MGWDRVERRAEGEVSTTADVWRLRGRINDLETSLARTEETLSEAARIIVDLLADASTARTEAHAYLKARGVKPPGQSAQAALPFVVDDVRRVERTDPIHFATSDGE